MPDKCKDCKNELFSKFAEAERKIERLERYNKFLESCLDVKDELCKALREDNEEMRNKLRIYENDR